MLTPLVAAISLLGGIILPILLRFSLGVLVCNGATAILLLLLMLLLPLHVLLLVVIGQVGIILGALSSACRAGGDVGRAAIATCLSLGWHAAGPRTVVVSKACRAVVMAGVVAMVSLKMVVNGVMLVRVRFLIRVLTVGHSATLDGIVVVHGF